MKDKNLCLEKPRTSGGSTKFIYPTIYKLYIYRSTINLIQSINQSICLGSQLLAPFTVASSLLLGMQSMNRKNISFIKN